MKTLKILITVILMSATLSNFVDARKRCTNFSPTPCCEKGSPLTGSCGRGGKKCLPNYKCNIHVTDKWAVCCPRKRKRCTNFSPTPCCRKGRPLTGYCGRGGKRCPPNYKCIIHVTDKWAVCCPRKRKRCTNFSPTPCCRKGIPLTGHCGRGGQRCPPNYDCNIHVTDKWAVCCPRKRKRCTNFSPSPCCRKGNPLTGNCGRGGQRCPPNYECNIHVTDKWAVCCPKKRKRCTNFSPTPCCRKGSPLTGHCGRGGQRCPPNYECNIHVTDKWAVCCPRKRKRCTNFSPTPCCRKGSPMTGHCGRGGQRCPPNYECNIHVTDKWAVCCPRKRKRCTNFSPTPCCKKGSPLTGHCGRGGQRCPPNYECSIHVTDKWAVCCPRKQSCSSYSSKACCPKGIPLPNIHCGRGGSHCPECHECIRHYADKWAVCCPKD